MLRRTGDDTWQLKEELATARMLAGEAASGRSNMSEHGWNGWRKRLARGRRQRRRAMRGRTASALPPRLVLLYFFICTCWRCATLLFGNRAHRQTKKARAHIRGPRKSTRFLFLHLCAHLPHLARISLYVRAACCSIITSVPRVTRTPFVSAGSAGWRKSEGVHRISCGENIVLCSRIMNEDVA